MKLFNPTASLSELKDILKIPKNYVYRYCIIDYLIENGRKDALVYYIKTLEDISDQNILHSIQYNMFTITRILIETKKYIDKNFRIIITRFLKDAIIANRVKNSYDMKNIQYIFKILNSYLNDKFVLTMINLYDKRIERSKKIIYYASINVLCNPNHPIGYKCISREYECISREYERLTNNII